MGLRRRSDRQRTERKPYVLKSRPEDRHGLGGRWRIPVREDIPEDTGRGKDHGRRTTPTPATGGAGSDLGLVDSTCLRRGIGVVDCLDHAGDCSDRQRIERR